MRLIELLKSKKGTSLAELLVFILLLFILLPPTMYALFSSFKSYQYNVAQNYNVSSARTVLLTIQDELRYCSAFSISADGRKITYTLNEIQYVIEAGTGDAPNTLLIKKDNLIIKQIAPGGIAEVSFVKDATIANKLHIGVLLKDSGSKNSPGFSISNSSIILQNIKKGP